MEIFKGKTPTERNKTIAAIVLGVLALFSLYMAFGPSFSSSKASPIASASPSPKTAPQTNPDQADKAMPPIGEQYFGYVTTPVIYNGVNAPASDTGRNIFAFYEPPPPTPFSPTPLPPVKTPTPAPTPPQVIAYVSPQTLYAGTGTFHLEVNGDKFTPDTRIFFNQSQMPTMFVTAQKLTADIPAALIAGEGPKTILVQTPDGKLWSNQVMLNVQAPPKPQFQYVGMIARKRYNNDTAYLQEPGKQLPTAARLNDVVGGRFRLVSISAAETIFEDVNLGFRHSIKLFQPAPGTLGNGGRPDFPGNGFPGGNTFNPTNPQQNYQGIPPNTPGFPTNPQYVPPGQRRPTPQPKPDKRDVDDNDDNDDGDN